MPKYRYTGTEYTRVKLTEKTRKQKVSHGQVVEFEKEIIKRSFKPVDAKVKADVSYHDVLDKPEDDEVGTETKTSAPAKTLSAEEQAKFNELKVLQSEFQKKTGNPVPNNKKNNAERIKSKLAE